jgi:colanic acid/amylovoran biosynthesis protein
VTAEWRGTLHEAVWGLRPNELEDDDRIAAAAARVGAGRLAHRPVDPHRYGAALFLGGGTLTSLWGDTLVAPRAVLGSALRRAGVPYVLTGQGIGPLDDADRALVEHLAAGASGVAGRDPASSRALGPGAVTVGDDAMVLHPAACARPVEGPYLVLSVRAADYVAAAPADLERWAAEVDRYAAAQGLTVVGVPFNDQPRIEEVATLLGLARSDRAARWLVRDFDPDPRRVATVLAGAGAVVTHSYHAALLALVAGVPAVLGAASPYYEGKAEGLRALLDLPDEVVVRGDEPLDLERRVEAVRRGLDHAAITEMCAAVGQRLSSSAAPAKGHTSGSTTGSSGAGRTA